jgi:hypothetical protein
LCELEFFVRRGSGTTTASGESFLFAISSGSIGKFFWCKFIGGSSRTSRSTRASDG